MPELPEVEVLARHLRRFIVGQTIRRVQVRRPRICRPDSPQRLARVLSGRRIERLDRRAKYLVFATDGPGHRESSPGFLVHLGMNGRLFLHDPVLPLPPHTAAILELDRGRLVFQDTRYFGRLTLDLTLLERLGPEPLGPALTPKRFAAAMASSRQAVKVRLLDQAVLAGVGNIYACEALFRARIAPARAANQLTAPQVLSLRRAVRAVLREAIAWGSTVPLNWSGADSTDRLFYYGQAPGAAGSYQERLRVYDRAGQPCPLCRHPIERFTQAGRSTYACPNCQQA